MDVFDAYRLVTFPFLANGSTLTLDLPVSVVLASTDLSQYAKAGQSDIDSCCLESKHLSIMLHLCSPYCLCLRSCHSVPTNYLSQVQCFIYAFPVTTSSCSHSRLLCRVCPEGTTYRTLSGHLALHVACYLHSSVFKPYPQKLL